MQSIKKSEKVFLPYYGKWVVLLLITFLFSTCKQALPPEEGRKHLRAFDNEMIQLISRMGKTDAFRAFVKLSVADNPPIPYLKNNSAAAYDFDANRGVYQLNDSSRIFERLTESKAVEITYPLDSKWDSLATFSLINYAETQTALQMIFPQKLKANITAGTTILFNASLDAIYAHDLPAKMTVELSFANFKVLMLLNTTFRRSHAEVNIEFEVEENGEKKLICSLTSDVKSINNVLYYSNIDVSLKAFPIQLTYQSDQDFFSTNPDNFIATFNKHTQCHFSRFDGKAIGQVFLTKIAGRDRINPMIRYPDGSEENLEELLFVIQKLLNMKMFVLDGLAYTQLSKQGLEARPPSMAFCIVE